MKMVKYWMLALLLAGFMVTGCDKDDPDPEPEVPDPNEAPALTQKINGFIKTAMSDIYLWYNTLPTIDIKYETDSKAYFSTQKTSGPTSPMISRPLRTVWKGKKRAMDTRWLLAGLSMVPVPQRAIISVS